MKMIQKRTTPVSTFMVMPSLPEHSFWEILEGESPVSQGRGSREAPEWASVGEGGQIRKRLEQKEGT